MRLTDFTDYSLRVMVFLNRKDELVTLNELSQQLAISRNHLMKIVNKLLKYEYINAVRGRNGGLYLNEKTGSARVGDIVRNMEESFGLVSCMRDDNCDCPFSPKCKLQRSINRALDAFIAQLNLQTLDEIS